MAVINVAVAGALGKMGLTVAEAVNADAGLKLTGLVDVNGVGTQKYGITVIDEISREKFDAPVDVIIDFTNPKCVFKNVMKAISEKINCVVGTTGLSDAELSEIEKAALSNGVAVLVAPNFAIGAVLMMKFARTASKFMKKAEIIEFHHDKKMDAPSGTALLTAKMMAESYNSKRSTDEILNLEGVRGGAMGGVSVHSVRLPGLVAHQEVIFGDIGQTLTIRHDSLSRESFMPGVVLAVKEIIKRKGFYFGLENFMELGD